MEKERVCFPSCFTWQSAIKRGKEKVPDDVDLDAREDGGLSEYDEGEEDSDDSQEQLDDGEMCSSFFISLSLSSAYLFFF